MHQSAIPERPACLACLSTALLQQSFDACLSALLESLKQARRQKNILEKSGIQPLAHLHLGERLQEGQCLQALADVQDAQAGPFVNEGPQTSCQDVMAPAFMLEAVH